LRRSLPATDPSFRDRLESLYTTFDHADSATDPVHIVRRYRSREDREIVGFCAAALAFGRVASVLQSIEALLEVMGPHPAEFVREFEPIRDSARIEPLVHRWIRGRDLVALLLILQRMLREATSIEAFFVAGDDPSSSDIARARAIRQAGDRHGPLGSVRSRAEASRRLLFLSASVGRQRVQAVEPVSALDDRKDAIDLGVWSRVSPSRLIVPLDTHVIRLGRCLRLTRYTSPGWKMAAEITASLRAINPDDPVRFDFSLCHVGMMNACGFGRPQRDTHCPLRGSCHPRVRRRA
jgi:hypothetical protein